MERLECTLQPTRLIPYRIREAENMDVEIRKGAPDKSDGPRVSKREESFSKEDCKRDLSDRIPSPGRMFEIRTYEL